MRPPTPIGTHGEIHTRKLPNGKWVARTRYRDQHGKLRDTTARANTKTAAKTRLQEKLTQHQPTGHTLNSYINHWYNTYKTTVSPSTQRITQLVIKNNIQPHGNTPLHMLTVPILDNIIQQAAKQTTATDLNGRTYTKGGTSTAKRTRVILTLALNEAVREGHLPDNPATKTRKPEYKAPEPKALTPQQVQQLLHNIDTALTRSPRQKPTAYWLPDLAHFLAGTGTRIGEALALRWNRINWDTRQCTINATVILNGSNSVIQEKTKTGRERVITLPTWLINRLRDRQERCGGELVFSKIDGGLLNASAVSEKFAQYVGAEFAGVTPKVLRSTVATLVERSLGMDAAGLQLGHEGTATTRRSYVERNGVAPIAAVLEELTIYSP